MRINNHIKTVCQIGQGNKCCRYLVVGTKGFECAKGTRLQELFDLRAKYRTMIAVSDNCDGKTIKELNKQDDVQQS